MTGLQHLLPQRKTDSDEWPGVLCVCAQRAAHTPIVQETKGARCVCAHPHAHTSRTAEGAVK